MAAKEIYDYLPTKEADYTATELTVTPQRILTETADKKQVVHEYDSGSPDVVSFSDNPVCEITLMWPSITESDAGTILDMYLDTNKANARERTFYFSHPDGHSYTVRFLGPLSRKYTRNLMAGSRRAVDQITLGVEGIKP